ncbi:MAG: phospho-N-acetylmuramoyl-pentapeptide-transferase, partial [Chitinophagia bacterium]|nr:phospho-N-acetylmuramoyl-pentapeptide-transferase [Chitinophagia bacterium]
LGGASEQQVVVGFWTLSLILVALGLVLLP